MENFNEQVFEMFDQGKTPTQIARKLKVKVRDVREVLGNAADKGAGDKVEQVTEALGIKAVVEEVFGDDCGCKARKEKLNKLFPNRKLNDLSDEAFVWLDEYFANAKSYVNRPEQEMLVKIYNEVFNAKRVVSSCGPCVATLQRELREIYEAAK
jgi:hypothetical protein